MSPIYHLTERKAISERTKAALAAAKARGTRLGATRKAAAPRSARARPARRKGAQFAATIAEQLNAWKFATADGDQLLSARCGAATTLLRRRLLRLALAARTSHHRRTLSSRSVGVVASKYGRYRCADKSKDRK
jgi:hypothetical protein